MVFMLLFLLGQFAQDGFVGDASFAEFKYGQGVFDSLLDCSSSFVDLPDPVSILGEAASDEAAEFKDAAVLIQGRHRDEGSVKRDLEFVVRALDFLDRHAIDGIDRLFGKTFNSRFVNSDHFDFPPLWIGWDCPASQVEAGQPGFTSAAAVLYQFVRQILEFFCRPSRAYLVGGSSSPGRRQRSALGYFLSPLRGWAIA
jgi:hypothetical protein